MNWINSNSYISPKKKKTLIQNSIALKNYESWKGSHKNDEEQMENNNNKVNFYFKQIKIKNFILKMAEVEKRKNEVKEKPQHQQQQQKKISKFVNKVYFFLYFKILFLNLKIYNFY